MNLNDAKMGKQNNCIMWQLILELQTKRQFPTNLIGENLKMYYN